MYPLLAELRVQWRSGLYAVYAVMTAVFVGILFLIPAPARPLGLRMIVLMDPSLMGFFFAGGMTLLERDQGVLAALQTSRWGFAGYWRTKVASLLLLAAGVSSLLLGVSAVTGLTALSVADVAVVLLGVVLTVPVFFSLGVWVAGHCRAILTYFVLAGVLTLPLMYPVLELAGIRLGAAGLLSPIWGGLVLITAGGIERAMGELLLAAAGMAAWNA